MGWQKRTSSRRVALHCFFSPKVRADRFGEMHLFADGSYIGIDPTGDHELNIALVCEGDRVHDCGGTHGTLDFYIQKSKNFRILEPQTSRFRDLRTMDPIAPRSTNAPTLHLFPI